MNRTMLLRRWTIFAMAVLVLLGVALAASAPQTALAVGKPELKRALLGTVRVAVPIDAQQDMYSTGSGTVLTADGYILTNFHVMGDKDKGTLYNKQGLAMIAVNSSDLKSLPTWLYQATMVKGDPTIDLAVLKISAPFKGSGALPDNLGLTPIPIADSDAVEIGDAVHVIGYPGIGGDSVTYTSGTISGFLDDNNDKVIDWLKTDAEVNHGNSGGLAINDNGEMIGIPTAGITEDNSTGKISLIRPVNRALSIIKAAMVQDSTTLDSPGTTTAGTTTDARITKLVFSDSVDANKRPGKTATAFASGVTTIYAVFDYQGFADGQKFQAVWNRDGQQDVVTAFDWDGGGSGTYWITIANQKGITPGTFDLAITLDGASLYKARLTVGTAATPTPAAGGSSMSAPTFAEGVSANDDPVRAHNSGDAFAAGTTQIYGFASYQNMQDGLPWSHVWYVDGEQVLKRDSNWQWGAKGTFWVSIANKSGLPNGQYKLELYVGDQLMAQAETAVGNGGGPLVSNSSVQVIGTVLDEDTRRPIQGALVVVLNPGVDPNGWLSDPVDADVYAGGQTDSKGQFSLDNDLARGETYSIIAVAKGYHPLAESNFSIDVSTESPLELEITLQQ